VPEKIVILPKHLGSIFLMLLFDVEIDHRPTRVRINSKNSVLRL
jgi:hypothetical protein